MAWGLFKKFKEAVVSGARAVGRFFRRAAPVIVNAARAVAPIVGAVNPGAGAAIQAGAQVGDVVVRNVNQFQDDVWGRR